VNRRGAVLRRSAREQHAENRRLRDRIDVTRFFNDHPDAWWTVNDVAADTHVALGRVRALLTALVEEGWLREGVRPRDRRTAFLRGREEVAA
jgi:hypothetical protein